MPLNTNNSALEPLCVSPREGARLLSIGVTRFYELLNDGTIESRLVGGRRLVSYQSLKQFAGAE
jgi:excisionase family DNA binding protein